MKNTISFTGSILLLAVSHLSAATLYVSLESTNSMPPYASWATAATNIQDALDAAAAGDEVVVTNGVYGGGLAVTNPLTLRSVNGPQLTLIDGGGAVQCASLTEGASLTGFTLTNGVDNIGNGGGGVWCAATNAFLTNCTLIGNSAYFGGGAYGGTLCNCTLTGNSATNGGGGAFNSTVTGCILIGNLAPSGGGGAQSCALYNCYLSQNTGGYGGAANGSTLINCTVVGNTARYGGGVYGSSVTNCIVFFNEATDWSNYDESTTLSYCCTTPQPAAGMGNLSADPQLASGSHLSAGSPCRGAGSSAFVAGLDIDGEPWGTPPSIGCDEFYAGAVTGPLTVSLLANSSNVSAGYPVSLTALIEGRTTVSVWDFGDGDAATNQPYITHAWTEAGDYLVALWAFNESHLGGVSATMTIHVVAQPVLYVAATSTNPQPPYSSWATAATNLQDAVDAATVAGALILATNGVYTTGWRTTQDAVTNRLALTKPVTVQSVNGPDVTAVVGAEGGSVGAGAGPIRCAYVGSGAVLSGFALTNGVVGDFFPDFYDSTATGGGAWCEALGTLTNCILGGNRAGSAGGGVYGGRIYNSALIGNGAFTGGGAADATLVWSRLEGNDAASSGGATGGTLYHCTLASNYASGFYKAGGYGGGASGSTLYFCALVSNGIGGGGGPATTPVGAGAYACVLHNCTLIGNSAPHGAGGGASDSTLSNCILTGNSAIGGGGANGGTLYNCTLTGNSALTDEYGNPGYGGGAAGGTLYNCIVYFNTASGGANYDSSSILNYCCTTPLPAGGSGNIAFDPQLASASHLSAESPCRGAGNAAYATGTDIDGEPWGNPPSIGCDEYHPGAVTGPLTVSLLANYTNVSAGYPVSLTALIEGRTTVSVWDFGDGDVAINQPYLTHAWTETGDYLVALWAFNESHLGGVSATVRIHVVAHPVYYVAATSTNPQPPYANWATAATNIQDAVDAAVQGEALVLVTNGVYAGGAVVGKPLTLRSVNGALFTVINGEGANRCASLTEGASLTGFTLTNGVDNTGYGGGGVWCASTNAFLTNCTLTGNWADYQGGGAYGGTLYNCALTGNSAAGYGGGANGGTLHNCTLTGNSATYWGGGAYGSTLYNCILYFNTAVSGENYDAASILNYCCTTPLPTNGVANITSVPLFVDYGSGNLRLQTNSPCINAGNNAYGSGTTDLDGNARIVSGTVDIGAYEFQRSGSVISYAWLQQYGFPTDGSADYADPDHDGMNNWQEWVCGTDPTNPLSVLRLLSATPRGPNATVTWQSIAGVSYFLERSPNLAAPFTLLTMDVVGQAGTTSLSSSVIFRRPLNKELEMPVNVG